MTVRGAAFLGIGAMVGAGIFALLGEAGAVAGAAVWLSFLLAGIVAALLGYTVVKLGVRYPSSGGLIAYLVEGFGNGRLVGHRLVARLFRRDRDRLFDGRRRVRQLCNVAVHRRRRRCRLGQRLHLGDRAGMLAINLVGSRVVDRAQSLIVIVLLAVFAVFIAVTIADLDPDLLAFSGYPPLSDIVSSVALTFFAYLGFSVITFSVGDLRDPARELPRRCTSRSA